MPYKMLGELFSAAACEKEKLTVEGAGHALSSSVDPELYWSTVERFIENISAAKALTAVADGG